MTIKIEEKFKEDFICNYRNDLDIIKVKAALSFRENYSEIREYRNNSCKTKNKKHVFAFTFACLLIMCVVMISTLEKSMPCGFYLPSIPNNYIISDEGELKKIKAVREICEEYNINRVNAYGVISDANALKESLPNTFVNYKFCDNIKYSFAYIVDTDIEYLAIYNITYRKAISLFEIIDYFELDNLLECLAKN